MKPRAFCRQRRLMFAAVVMIGFCPLVRGATGGGNAALARAIDDEDLVAIERLIGGDVDVDFQAGRGRTALMIAAKYGRRDLVRRLLELGARVNVRSENGGTALMFATLGNDLGTLDALLFGGADVNAVGGFDWTALMIAAVKGDAAAVERLLHYGAELNRADVYGWTPLMRAVYENRFRVVVTLLGSPALDLHARNDAGATALHLAAFRGSADIVEALVSHGSALDAVDGTGRTPAEAAVHGGHLAVAEWLRRSLP